MLCASTPLIPLWLSSRCRHVTAGPRDFAQAFVFLSPPPPTPPCRVAVETGVTAKRSTLLAAATAAAAARILGWAATTAAAAAADFRVSPTGMRGCRTPTLYPPGRRFASHPLRWMPRLGQAPEPRVHQTAVKLWPATVAARARKEPGRSALLLPPPLTQHASATTTATAQARVQVVVAVISVVPAVAVEASEAMGVIYRRSFPPGCPRGCHRAAPPVVPRAFPPTTPHAFLRVFPRVFPRAFPARQLPRPFSVVGAVVVAAVTPEFLRETLFLSPAPPAEVCGRGQRRGTVLTDGRQGGVTVAAVA